jgi:AraC-like DNA-binding protein
MSYRLYEPSFPLRQYVDFIWRVENARASAPSRQRIYPDGAMALVVHLRKPTATYFIDDETHSIRVPLLAGPYSRSFQIDPSQPTAAIGVQFRPGAARAFYPVAAHELHNADIALSDLDPAEADRLLNEICSATGADAQLRAMERYLNEKLVSSAAIHPVVGYAVEQLSRTGAAGGVGRIQAETGLSHTRFIELFREHVGLTPKLFCRVRRFQALIERIRKGLPVNWAELAVECGYFDQAHLIRDFRAFAGVTPLAYSRALSQPTGSLAAELKG